MLHYSVDNEIMMDLYRDFLQLKGEDYDQLHELGAKYQTLTEMYKLDEKTIYAIERLSAFKTEGELEEVETKIVHGYLTAKSALKKEQAEYKEFAMQFDGEERRALLGLTEYVVGKKRIPYKIKNRDLHIEVLSTPAMSLELDFEDVLIEDGRHPREILITHIAGESFEEEEKLTHEDGTEEIIQRKRYRLNFVNGLSEGPYQAKESAFVFDGLHGFLYLYDYNTWQESVDVDADKLPWRLLMRPLAAVLEKAQILGVEVLNEAEVAALQPLCVFYELIWFYLQPTTEAGIGRSLIRFDDELAANFAFSQEDLDATALYLAESGLDELEMWLHKANTDRMAFCRYWIQFASMKKAEILFGMLAETLGHCGAYYDRKPLSVIFRKHHDRTRRILNDYFGRHKWRGEFPCFRRVKSPEFLEVSNVYQKMYTYINEKQKAYYVDFIEAMTEQSYSLTAVAGYILLRDGEDAKNYRALNGFFMDGGRRNSHIIGQITFDGAMGSEEMEELLGTMFQDIERQLNLG